MFTHNIFRSLRVRALVVHDRRMLILPRPDVVGGNPPQPGAAPGGGLRPNETMFEAAEREVFEESGLRVKAKLIAFLREWVVPGHWPLDQTREMLLAHGVPREETAQSDHAYALEVWVWAHLVDGEGSEPDRADVIEGACTWVRFEDVEKEPVFPRELRALARELAGGRVHVGVPLFTSGLGDPWDEPDWEASWSSAHAERGP
jgi:8-oxo-dGTP pyrophosphatase MutT (NUDIX family)